jgi:hypothetical protein
MTLIDSAIPKATLFRHGKVREVYEAGPDQLVMVASDRLSAFDVVLPTPIPDKGRVLTQLSNFWFGRTATIVPNHLLETDVTKFPAPFSHHDELAGRARNASISSASRAATSPAPGGRSTGRAGRSPASASRGGSRSPPVSTIRSSRRPPRRSPVTTRTSRAPSSRPRSVASSRRSSRA